MGRRYAFDKYRYSAEKLGHSQSLVETVYYQEIIVETS